MTEPIWSPTPEQVDGSRMATFLRQVQARVPSVTDPASLHAWSVAEPAAFWECFRAFADVRFATPASAVVDDADRMPGARWFPDARLSFPEHLLRHADVDPGAEALVAWSESGRQSAMTFGELRRAVAATARALAELGVVAEDRVAGFLPNIPEAVVAMLATTSLGAVWSSCSPDFGDKGVLDRFGQIAPKVLFTADGYRYAGKAFDSLEKARGLLRAIPAIEHVVVIPSLDEDATLNGDRRVRSWDAFLAPHLAAGDAIDFAYVPFDHPLYVMYSSGTTGLPKVPGPRRRRHASPAPQRARPAHRSRTGRPHLLLHDLWLDDVELARFEPRRRRHRGALRRRADEAAPRRPLGSCRARAVDRLRYQRQVPGDRREGGARTAQEPRPVGVTRHPEHGVAAGSGEL